MSDVPDQALWAMEYLHTEVAELGSKAAKQAASEDALRQFAGVGDRDALTVLARDSWDFYYSTVTLDIIQSLKPARREGLPAEGELLEILFEKAFLPALREHLEKLPNENDDD